MGTDLVGEVGYTGDILLPNEEVLDDEEYAPGWHGASYDRFGLGDGGGHAARACSDLYEGPDDGTGVQLDRMLYRRQCRRALGHEGLVGP